MNAAPCATPKRCSVPDCPLGSGEISDRVTEPLRFPISGLPMKCKHCNLLSKLLGYLYWNIQDDL